MTSVPDLSIREHIELAHAHAKRALDLAYADEPQDLFTRLKIARVRSMLFTLMTQIRSK